MKCAILLLLFKVTQNDNLISNKIYYLHIHDRISQRLHLFQSEPNHINPVKTCTITAWTTTNNVVKHENLIYPTLLINKVDFLFIKIAKTL